MLAGCLLAGLAADPASALVEPVVVGHTGTVTSIARWEIQSTAKAPQPGTEVAADGFATDGWFPVSARATVMAGLIENGRYPNVFYSDNLRAVEEPDASGTMFVVPWWYRTAFVTGATAPGEHVLLRLNGLNPAAEVWLNGERIAGPELVAGAYPVVELDITHRLHEGRNTLALRVEPAEPRRHLSIGWVDWNPTPPDNNMGPWRGVDILRTGPVQLRFPAVLPDLAVPKLDRADLTVVAELRNLDAVAHDATVTGVVADVHLARTVRLEAGATTRLVFNPASDRALALRHPRVWWPTGLGAHPLYELTLAASVDKKASDAVAATFGIRRIDYRLTADGFGQFLINGQPLLIRGAGWTPDLFLRADPARLTAAFDYVDSLGLNAIRTEGKLEDAPFYDLADRRGILVLLGWECCDKWESAAKTGGEPWTAADQSVAVASMASEARLLRGHPSVIGFMIGSDNAPPPAVAAAYVAALRDADWPLPVIAAAVPQATAETGPSGMKMEGPYSWVPPAYWYGAERGAAFGFDSEVSAGASIPRLDDLKRTLGPQELEALWKYPEQRQYHASAAWSVFATLTPFDKALAARYGAFRDLEDYVRKAQLDNYDGARAQFEAFSARRDAPRPATGVIYWMLNSAWPSLHWHLFADTLEPAGAFYGARLANEALHIQYSYDSGAVLGVNQTGEDQSGLTATLRVRNLDGRAVYSRTVDGIRLPANRTQPLAVVPALEGLSPTYFIELELRDRRGALLSRNVYWLPTVTDELDWPNSNWYLTPVTRYADLGALAMLPAGSVTLSASERVEGATSVVTARIAVPSDAPAVALFLHLSVRRAQNGDAVLPVAWSDNDVTLWPGEALTLSARVATPADGLAVRIEGFNVPASTAEVERDAPRRGR